MTEQSRESQDFNNYSAQLQIFVDKEGGIGYNCDWDETADGFRDLSVLFHEILNEELINKILSDIDSQCVLTSSDGEFEKVESAVSKLLSPSPECSDDPVVISPDIIEENL